MFGGLKFTFEWGWWECGDRVRDEVHSSFDEPQHQVVLLNDLVVWGLTDFLTGILINKTENIIINKSCVIRLQVRQ